MTTQNTISINDLAVMVQIIDLGSEKGLFKGPDLKPVGELRDRLVTFIKENAPTKEQANANPATE
jgi:hypothetical protein